MRHCLSIVAASITEATSITTVVAIWGAITGSLALLIQLVSFNRDRSKLKLKVKMYTCASEPHFTSRKIFEFHVTNIGRRVCIIESAVLELQQHVPFISNRLPSSYMYLLSPGKDEAISLAENEKHIFKRDPIEEEIVKRIGWFARVSLTDTTGKKYYKHFVPMTA